MHDIRMERDMIEVTRGPTISHPGDTYRKFIPGHWTYWVTVDGVEEPIDEETFRRLQAENASA